MREVEIDSAASAQAVFKAFSAALKKLEQSREREGAHLRADMESQIGHMREVALSVWRSARRKTACASTKRRRPNGETASAARRGLGDFATCLKR